MSNAPHMRYELTKVDGLLVSNSKMFGQKILIDNAQNNSKELQIELLVSNSGPKGVVVLHMNEARLFFLQTDVPAECKFDPENMTSLIEVGKDVYIKCKVIFKPEAAIALGKSDLIGELRIPIYENKSKFITTSIYVRNEDLK